MDHDTYIVVVQVNTLEDDGGRIRHRVQRALDEEFWSAQVLSTTKQED